ncbi:hypothetical protein DR864_10730 [Runella rosea]|uniref:RNA polymerase sigma factor 70 region 4 type 2 domain-containing protein n=1 Tax=Runella rosea TaxID=2259595 RepID=A0A344THR1_9BACT|nr:sigma-70 family RNA polymerase sigma factor [Runella rosea]AXE18182.1 hypothetical protein DR864_10730 [Runella rosea]
MSILPFWGRSQTRRDCSQYESIATIKTTFRNATYRDENSMYNCLYILYYAKVESYVLNHGGKKDDALDVFQDVVAVVLVAMRNTEKLLAIDTDDFAPYLMGIVKNTWRGRFRKKSSTERVTDFTTEVLNEDSEDLNEMLDILEDAQIVQEAIANLPIKQQDFVKLFYFEDKSYLEIAQELGQSADSLKANRYRIVQKLRDYLLRNQ